MHPENNECAIAEEVTLRGKLECRPDLVLYLNDIAIAVIELKNSRASLGDGRIVITEPPIALHISFS